MGRYAGKAGRDALLTACCDLWGFFGLAGPLVTVGLLQTIYTVFEGDTVEVCVQMTTGEISQPLSITLNTGVNDDVNNSECTKTRQ